MSEQITVFITKGRFAGYCGRVVKTFGRQSVVVEGLGVVYRRSLDQLSRRNLAAAEAGVTWAWLRETMTEAEADAWLEA